jgi:hypothetical protein
LKSLDTCVRSLVSFDKKGVRGDTNPRHHICKIPFFSHVATLSLRAERQFMECSVELKFSQEWHVGVATTVPIFNTFCHESFDFILTLGLISFSLPRKE